MITYFQAIILGLVQGVTELFPISSLGHSVIIPPLFHWNINQKDPYFLTFLVATHTATALVLFFFFLKDWIRIIKGIFSSLKNREIVSTDEKLAWLLIAATIPAGILGVLFETELKDLFANPQLVAFALILNGGLLYGAESLRKRQKNQQKTEIHSDARIAKLSWTQASIVGLLQSFALIPGFSRTGASMTGSLIIGLSHEDAARFAFLLATPIIAGAAILKLPELASSNAQAVLGPTITGFIAAGIAAYFSVKYLTKYFETKKLTPFAIYCVITGIVSSLFFLFIH